MVEQGDIFFWSKGKRKRGCRELSSTEVFVWKVPCLTSSKFIYMYIVSPFCRIKCCEGTNRPCTDHKDFLGLASFNHSLDCRCCNQEKGSTRLIKIWEAPDVCCFRLHDDDIPQYSLPQAKRDRMTLPGSSPSPFSLTFLGAFLTSRGLLLLLHLSNPTYLPSDLHSTNYNHNNITIKSKTLISGTYQESRVS